MAGEGRQLFCRLITPERVVYDGEADLVVAKIADGEIGVMVDHYPVISTVDFWDVRITRGEERRVYATSDGFFKVADNLVQILVEEAVPASEINVEEAEHRIEQAERELGQLPEEEDEDSRRAREEISRRVRLGENLVRVARRYGGG
ncbi:ATP synthase F1, epsilon subunit [Rubrobacter xylanophilus DSM 9941]|uniref:ATP synthase epsilon chain n=1 Tax=Rubrobacter xylanophilus (strain DSM 9941 / JCM 11954 / NBRC 16129 / PRD-1) TaxID=266117 RepID=ATPE_RUBXD|nr:ATP synthase F1 subunit epsilon [Rubrobacter xylanophilus]Q1AVI0.1 RecName: Full=ATP synthase epsilon chain; AltName: Full=ATP synthase F1 sector epsilon subunit; AltName: Full=F-ATPase epsilon subunit [Rubrobacter xylanophilus DSM 9941]ABG04598.1 ATP synthase F1, epsilon subunit [Rubrobacter xylanophilus DSM 9941]